MPFTAGGLSDVLARGIAQELTTRWARPVIVENRPGANTIIAAEYVARAAPDGYTLLMANDPTLSLNQYLYRKLSYDPVKDFVPVINLVQTREILLASNGSGIDSVQELVARAKAKPGEVSYGSYGVGSKAQLDAEAFASMAGIRLNHVPYKGVADVMAALVGGQIDMAWVGVPPSIPMVKSGKVKLLGVAAPQRIAAFPDAPTLAELGFPKMVSQAWFGLVAPSGTPQAVVDKIAADVAAVVSQQAFQEKYVTGVGLEPLNQGPKEFERFLAQDRAEYEASIRNANVKLD
ncbi:MAG: tripartite tricarboxylate transporter substrate binding protein [Pigmentiphaga sp.]|uniref:Bug family tripartite tricarboxylate transporter substrate binding protein n=1 Tax=Pigmentiphaga sp. TaxID=1977564 RepID=UPI0029AA88BD|nr:tripartite tricarboxylate transporter substrate binding protein [Pigmentiphaga sp.]MDX3904590.1 tripartite tricarboxylate transporter substrate binding protein [Pigmentiphaga sp.]